MALSDVEQIALVAARISGLAHDVVEAHESGSGPGTIKMPWTVAAQHQLTEVYLSHLPTAYLSDLVVSFETTARMMAARPCPEGVEDEWFIVTSYLRAAAAALCDCEAVSEYPVGSTAFRLERESPAGLWAKDLAGRYSAEGARRLRDASATVGAAVLDSPNPLTNDEREWLTRIGNGETITAVAADSAISLRTFNRRLASLWKRIGVDGTVDGIGRCAANGWIDVAADPKVRSIQRRGPS